MNLLEDMAAEMQASKAWPAVFGAGSAQVLARAALTVLRRRGYLNELGIEAARQEPRKGAEE